MKSNAQLVQTEIGELPEDWMVKSASSVVEIISGGTPKTSVKDYWDGNIPWLSVVDFNTDQKRVYETEKSITELGLKNSSTNILGKGMLIISARGTVGVIAQLGKDMAFNQSCYGLDAKKDISSNDFLYYTLKSRIDSIRQKSHGSVFSTITRNTFNDIYLPVPPIDEQHHISSILSSLDDKIELNRRMNKTLEEIGKALFHQLFEHEDSSTIELNEIVDFNPRESLSKSTEARFIEMKDLPEEGMWISSNVFKPYKGGSKFRNGDSLMARITPCLENGKSGFVNSLNEDELAFGSTEFIVLRPKKEIYEEFVYFLVRDEKFRNQAIRSMVGSSGRQRVQIDAIKSYELNIPSDEAIEKFHIITKGFFEQIKRNSIENERLADIRDLLLPRLMSGKIRVN